MRYTACLPCVLAAALLPIINAQPALGQTETMPDGWQDLPTDEFVDNAQRVLSAETKPSAEVIDEIHANAANRLGALTPDTSVDYGDLLSLYEWGRENLTADQRDATLARISQPADDFSDWTYSQLVTAYNQMGRSQVPRASRVALVTEWLADGNATTASSLEELAWVCRRVQWSKGLLPADQQPSSELLSALRSQAAQQLAGGSAGNALTFDDQLILYAWARDEMTREQRTQQETALADAIPNATEMADWSFAQVEGTYRRMERVGLSRASCVALVTEWLADDKVAAVPNLDELAWLCAQMEASNRLLPADQRPSSELLNTLRSNVAQRLADEPATGDLTYEQRLVLYAWAHEELTTEQQAQQETDLISARPGREETAAWSFRKMQRVHRRMGDVQLPEDAKQSLVLDWLDGRDVDALDSVGEVAWLCRKVTEDGVKAREFSVRWTGLVEAPQNGEYAFSICPINATFEHLGEFARQTTRVWVGGEQILDSSANGWTHRGTPVPLSAGQPTAIRVEYSFAYHRSSNPSAHFAHPAIARLLWERPGMDRTLVPASAFSLPDGSGGGLQAEYHLSVNGEQQTVVRTEPAIDHVWFGRVPIVPAHPELQSRLVDRTFTLTLEPQYLMRWDSEQRPSHLWPPPMLPDLLDAQQHAAVAAELLARPLLLESYSQASIRDFYWRCRTRVPEQALDVLGNWAQLHADMEPQFGDWLAFNRRLFKGITRTLVWQYRPHLDLLEERYLELPDGGCCLPVAYILSYGYHVEGRVKEWIEKLQTRLDDESLTGDRRVNWLLARAYAEEIRHNRPGRHYEARHRSLAGRGWIQEAWLVAQSESVKLRVHKEMAVRLAGRERFAGARQWLEMGEERFSDQASAQALAAWREQIDEAEAAFHQERQEAEENAQQVYIERLRARRQRAMERGASEAATRYEQLITAAGATVE